MDTKAQTTVYQIPDDGYAHVPLPFTFNYYGKTFTESWMYDNGIVSFLNPSDPQAINPGQWSAPESLGFGGKYYIAVLWADIAPTASTQYKTIYDGSSLKYLWNNVSEYYSGGTRLNSFSTTIKPDGSVAASYYSLNLSTSNVLAGTVGDPQLGEVQQVFAASFGTPVSTISDWSLAGKPDPCAGSQYWLPGCPGYVAPQPAEPAPQPAQEPVVATPEPVVAQQQVQQSAPAATTPQAQTATRAGEAASAPQQQRASSSISTGALLQLVRSEQSRVQALEASVVASTQQQAQDVAVASTQQASATQTTRTAGVQQTTELLTSVAASSSTAQQLVGYTVQKPNAVPEPLNAPAGLTDPVAVVPLVAPQLTTAPQSQPTAAVNRQAGDSTVAGAVSLKNLATVPGGFQAYQTALPDQPFYASREIYARQTVTDNVKAGRLLNSASDRKHQQMLQQQYRQGE